MYEHNEHWNNQMNGNKISRLLYCFVKNNRVECDKLDLGNDWVVLKDNEKKANQFCLFQSIWAITTECRRELKLKVDLKFYLFLDPSFICFRCNWVRQIDVTIIKMVSESHSSLSIAFYVFLPLFCFLASTFLCCKGGKITTLYLPSIAGFQESNFKKTY